MLEGVKVTYRGPSCGSSTHYQQLLPRVLLVIAPFFLVCLLNGLYVDVLSKTPWLYWLVDILTWVVLPLFIIYHLYCQYGFGLRDYGIEILSDQVTDPVAVRYGWADNPGCNLGNKEGLPATPFRTDAWYHPHLLPG